MPKGLGRALAGAVLGGIAGYGKGLAESGAAKREAALEQIKQFGMETLRSRNRREELGVASRLTEERETRKAGRGLIDTKNMIVGDDGFLYSVQKNPDGKPTLINLGIKGRPFNRKGEPLQEVGTPGGRTATTLVPRSEAVGMPGRTGAKEAFETRRFDEETARIEDERQAEQEANKRNPIGPDFLRPDAMREAYDGLTKEEWTRRDAEKRGRERRAREKQGRKTGARVSGATTVGRVYTMDEIRGMGAANLKPGMRVRKDGIIYVWDGREFQPAKD
ncbi:MAG: hypothetical protein IIC53_15490 [Proteobacteria bacterium]|nr:hypothetical protein [Pseudomonadota bacterium]